jgi:hypothetical protein
MSKLKLYIPKRRAGEGLTKDKVPSPLLKEIENADILLNHSILLAEIFGLDAADALESVNRVYHLASSSALFVKEDFEDILPILSVIRSRLSEKIDAKGWKTVAQDPLPAEYFEEDMDKRLCFKSHRLPILYFIQDIDQMSALFSYALQHDLFVEYIT